MTAVPVDAPGWLSGYRVRLYFDSVRRVWSLVDPLTRRVVGKAKGVVLRDCRMTVSEKVRQWVLRKGRKTPHAYVEGRVSFTRPELGHKGRAFTYSPRHPCGKFRTRDDRHTVSAAVVAVFKVIDGKPMCWAHNAVTERIE